MTIFYQQSGRRGEADFPKTLGTRGGTLRLFTIELLKKEFGVSLPERSVDLLPGTEGFQIWGVPSGASNILRPMKSGDIALLIGHLSKHSLEDGQFFYAGRVAYVLPEEDFAFSKKLWGDGGFPLIFFMQGALVDYSWCQFAKDFRFKDTYYLAGQTMRIPEDRLRRSAFGSQGTFAHRVGLPCNAG